MPRSRRRPSLLLLLVLLTGAVITARPGARPAASERAAVVHVLNRVTFGPTPVLVARVERMGAQAFIDEQLHPERLADGAMAGRLSGLTTLALSSRELTERYILPAMLERRERQRRASGSSLAVEGESTPPARVEGEPSPPAEEGRPRRFGSTGPLDGGALVLGELSQQKLLRAIFSERQLEEVLVDFWFNHFNVFAGKGPVRQYVTEYERDVIRPHVLGRFRDLLGATAKSPAMLFYLDNWQSTAAAEASGSGAAAGRRPARPGGRPRIGRVGASERGAGPRGARGLNENYARELLELHTLGVDGGYTQQDVQEVARAFTGWTIDGPRRGGGFRFATGRHDDGRKVVLGTTIKAGGGQSDGERVLDLLAAHPSTARHVATRLARRFVADEPPPALVDRIAARFEDTRGDLREVVRAVLASPEFLDPGQHGSKVKTPFEFVVSAVRATGGTITTALPLVRSLRELGMPLYFAQPPTGYADDGAAWVNTGSLVARMNFAVALVGRRLRGVEPDLGGPAGASDWRVASADRLLPAGVSAATHATLERAEDIDALAALALGSPEFQKR